MEEENNNVDNAKKTAKNVARKTGKIVKTVLSPIAIILIVILIVIIMIAAFTKIVKIEKGTNKPDDPKNAPGAVTNYANSVTIDEDGNMTFDKTAQEFWDELKKNNNDLLDYFDSPEELAKVMNASLVTEYLDTREDPSKEIDWSKINNDVNSKNAQGIVKLKRKNEAEAEFYMTYVSPKKFQELIDNYNNNPTKKNQVEAMRHFTLEKKKIGSSSRLFRFMINRAICTIYPF